MQALRSDAPEGDHSQQKAQEKDFRRGEDVQQNLGGNKGDAPDDGAAQRRAVGDPAGREARTVHGPRYWRFAASRQEHFQCETRRVSIHGQGLSLRGKKRVFAARFQPGGGRKPDARKICLEAANVVDIRRTFRFARAFAQGVSRFRGRLAAKRRTNRAAGTTRRQAAR